MSDIILHKENEAFLKVECEDHYAVELSNYFTFFVPGYRFMPTRTEYGMEKLDSSTHEAGQSTQV